MARAAVTKVTIRKEGGFTKESVQDIYDKVGELIDRPSAEALKEDFHNAGVVMAHELDSTAPYGEKKKKGGIPVHLRDAIFLTDAKPTQPFVLVGASFKRAPQGYWQEYGTSKMPAHPWFRPAMLRVRDQMTQIIIDGLKRTLGLK